MSFDFLWDFFKAVQKVAQILLDLIQKEYHFKGFSVFGLDIIPQFKLSILSAFQSPYFWSIIVLMILIGMFLPKN